jgi:hypothetical protein
MTSGAASGQNGQMPSGQVSQNGQNGQIGSAGQTGYGQTGQVGSVGQTGQIGYGQMSQYGQTGQMGGSSGQMTSGQYGQSSQGQMSSNNGQSAGGQMGMGTMQSSGGMQTMMSTATGNNGTNGGGLMNDLRAVPFLTSSELNFPYFLKPNFIIFKLIFIKIQKIQNKIPKRIKLT